ncbi:MAG: hypothetical protein M1840_002380 [Geoglossum simile]|nr:MAG: hypothetical protein M1840_002380 [Geoglossum simile]
MRFHIPLLLLTLFATTPTVVLAADCEDWDDNMAPFLKYHQNMIWSVRQRMCGDGECGSDLECTLTAYSKDGNVRIYRKDVQHDFQYCWDATANIITQCSRNWWKTGSWQLGDEFYQIRVSPTYEFKRRESGVQNMIVRGKGVGS